MLVNIFCNVFTAPPPKVEAPVAAPTIPPIPIRRPEVMLEDRTESIKGIRKAMVKAMTASLAVPHFGYKDEIILNELVRYGIFDTRESFTVWAIPRYVSSGYHFQNKSWQISDFLPVIACFIGFCQLSFLQTFIVFSFEPLTAVCLHSKISILFTSIIVTSISQIKIC